jgi:hypothetical protein
MLGDDFKAIYVTEDQKGDEVYTEPAQALSPQISRQTLLRIQGKNPKVG